MNIIAETERLLIREFKLSDGDDVLEFYGDSETMRYVSGGTPWTTEETKTDVISTYVKQYTHCSKLGTWAVVFKETGQVIGHAILKKLDSTESIEVAYLVSRKLWNKGYGTEVLTALMRYAKTFLSTDKLVAITSPENTSSRIVLEKKGFCYVGVRQYYGYTVSYFEITL